MLLLILFAAMSFTGMAEANLIVIGTATYQGEDYKLIYEDDQGLVWLDYSNKGQYWDQQMKWASGLNESGVLTYKLNPGISISWEGVWRLPLTVDAVRRYGYDSTTTAGFNITTSEMGHLYYKSLRNLGYYDTKGKTQTGFGLKNTGPFTNLRDDMYWSCTEYSINPSAAWYMSLYYGYQTQEFMKNFAYYGLAIRPGHVIVE
jgi:hypothetical protein